MDFNFNFHFKEYYRNKTTAELIQELTSLAKSSRVKLIEIEALVLFAAIIFSLLLVLGSYRRRSNSPSAKSILWIASTLNYPLVSYTIGLMHSFPYNDGGNLFAIWAILLIIVYGSADSFLVYSLDDHVHWKRDFVLQNIQFFWVAWLIRYSVIVDRHLIVPIWFLHFLGMLKRDQRIMSSVYASLSYELKGKDKLVADYMGYEHKNPDEVDAKHMKGYHYLVTGADKGQCTFGPASSYKRQLDIRTSHEVITVAKTWQCNGRLLQEWGDPKGSLKDLCLSFALFKLLRRRYSGYSFYEAHLRKTRDFVLRGLLADEDHERAFRVIEVELAFLFDFFYTKYPIIFSNGCLDLSYSALMFVPSCYWIVELISSKINQNIGATFTGVVVLVFVALVSLQLLVYVFSDWAKVYLLCQYVKKASWQNSPRVEELLGFVCQQPRLWATWQNKLGQYSLLESFNYKPWNVLSNVTFGLVASESKGQKKSDPTNLSTHVKKDVAESAKRILSDLLTLPANNARLKNGLQSLQNNGVSNALNWACETETHTQMILIWHIATHLCEIAASGSNHVRDEDIARDREVSCSLSRYCAYLVAFVPELLPDHICTTQDIFEQVGFHTEHYLMGTNCLRQRFDKMIQFGEHVVRIYSEDQKVPSFPIIQQGAILGKLLMETIPEEGRRWEVLADFWAELILFLAPSDNAKAHIENLANGGEFITHIWALLSHAGILELERGPIPPSAA